MTYKEAQEWIETNMNLIGTKTDKDMLIGDLLAVPSDTHNRKAFMMDYVSNRNKIASLLPYINGDMVIWAIDTEHLEANNVLVYKQLAE